MPNTEAVERLNKYAETGWHGSAAGTMVDAEAIRADVRVLIAHAETAARLSAETIAAQQAHNREEEGKRFKAEHDAAMWAVRWEETNAKLAVLIVAASAAYDYFSDKTDYDLDGGEFHGNREASLASELAEAIRRAKGERL